MQQRQISFPLCSVVVEEDGIDVLRQQGVPRRRRHKDVRSVLEAADDRVDQQKVSPLRRNAFSVVGSAACRLAVSLHIPARLQEEPPARVVSPVVRHVGRRREGEAGPCFVVGCDAPLTTPRKGQRYLGECGEGKGRREKARDEASHVAAVAAHLDEPRPPWCQRCQAGVFGLTVRSFLSTLPRWQRLKVRPGVGGPLVVCHHKAGPRPRSVAILVLAKTVLLRLLLPVPSLTPTPYQYRCNLIG
mmetsp:Transcript_2129/g.6745  ORF Transcript_2129/g.6745 Transcript_2129/m.6745 type:complete len:245 (+) Transcript_2129:385-1119(+)